MPLGRQHLSSASWGRGNTSVPACYWLGGNAESLITTGNEESGEAAPGQLCLQHSDSSAASDRSSRAAAAWSTGSSLITWVGNGEGMCWSTPRTHTHTPSSHLCLCRRGQAPAGSGQIPTARQEGRAGRNPSVRAARTEEDEEAVATQKPGTKSQHPGGEILLDLMLELTHGCPTGAGPC